MKTFLVMIIVSAITWLITALYYHFFPVDDDGKEIIDKFLRKD